MTEYTLPDFTRCPDTACDHDSPIGVDYWYDGERLFFNFWCPYCENGALEDDFRWYVRCPDCHSQQETLGSVDRITGTITEGGRLKFTCETCGAEAESYPQTRWDASPESPIFEPNTY